MLKKITLTLFIISIVFLGDARAQTDAAAEKQAVIKELVSLTNAGNQAEEFVEVFSRQMDTVRSAAISSLLEERMDLTAAEKKVIFDSLTENQKEMSKRLREKFIAKLNYAEMINEISAALYDKYFTFEEIKDLLAFYKTPTGQKTLKTMTALMNDSMQMTQDRLIPKIPIILKELETEEKQEIERRINEKKPRPKTSATR